MKSLLVATAILSMSLFTVSCSKDQVKETVNDAKIKTAETVGAAVEKELKEAYATVSVEGVDCQAEAVEIGGYTSDKVKELLKVEEEKQALSQSAIGSMVPIVCGFVVDTVFPELISKVETKYSCLKQLGQDKITKVGKDLCAGIDL